MSDEVLVGHGREEIPWLLRCKRCGELKNKDEYYVKKAKKNRYYGSMCKQCERERYLERSQDQREKARAEARQVMVEIPVGGLWTKDGNGELIKVVLVGVRVDSEEDLIGINAKEEDELQDGKRVEEIAEVVDLEKKKKKEIMEFLTPKRSSFEDDKERAEILKGRGKGV